MNPTKQMKEQFLKDLADIEKYLERETDPKHTESPVIFGILRVLWHILCCEIRKM